MTHIPAPLTTFKNTARLQLIQAKTLAVLTMAPFSNDGIGSKIGLSVGALNVMMGTYAIEGSFNQVFKKLNNYNDPDTFLNGVTNSCHYSPINYTGANKEVNNYWRCNNISAALKANPLYASPINQAVQEGRVAHSVGGIMGHYLMIGTPSWTSLQPIYGGVLGANNCTVDPTTGAKLSVNVFTNDDPGLTRGVICAVMIMDQKYRFRLANGYKTKPDEAMYMAAGDYLGSGAAAQTRRDLIYTGQAGLKGTGNTYSGPSVARAGVPTSTPNQTTPGCMA